MTIFSSWPTVSVQRHLTNFWIKVSARTWFIHFDGLCNYLHSFQKQQTANFFKNNSGNDCTSGCGSGSKILIWNGKYKLEAIAGARVCKYNLGTKTGKWKVSFRVGKHKLRARAGKCKLEARAGKQKLGAMDGKYKLGSRAGDHAKFRGLGITKTPVRTPFF